MATFTLAVVEHSESKCPLRQSSPDWALRLAQNLDDARATGFFEQQEHKGGIIFPETSHDEVAVALAAILPEHLDPELRDVEVTGDSLVARCAGEPSLLDGSADDPAALQRLVELARAFEAYFPERGLLETERLGHRRISLHDLPGYLREHAPADA